VPGAALAGCRCAPQVLEQELPDRQHRACGEATETSMRIAEVGFPTLLAERIAPRHDV
jgi:hypothetical protein